MSNYIFSLPRFGVSIALLVLLVVVVDAAPCTSYASKGNCAPVQAIPLFQEHLPEDMGINLRLKPCGENMLKDAPNVVNRFAVVGDFGLSGANCEARVALLLQKFESQYGTLDFVFTTGDNNYWNGGCETMDSNIGEFYSRFYTHGNSCSNPSDRSYNMIRNESATDAMLRAKFPIEERDIPHNRFPNAGSRFWPTIGNHDWDVYKVCVQFFFGYIWGFLFVVSCSSQPLP